MLHTFQQGRRGEGGGGCTITEVQSMPVRLLCWATVPQRETTVEKLETRKEEEERRGGGGGGGEGRSEVQATSGECGSFPCRQCSTHPQ